MKFIHLADLNIGRRVSGFSMIEDQKHILGRICDIIKEERPDAVVIAGGVYDRRDPSAEAVALFEDFISMVWDAGPEVIAVNGKHDPAELLSFGPEINEKIGLHFASGYDGSSRRVTLEDGYGKVHFHMLPYLKPQQVKKAFREDADAQKIESYTDAAAFAVSRMETDPEERNVIIAHQLCAGALRQGADAGRLSAREAVDERVFGIFDYAALGSLNAAQDVGSPRIRYAGSPLKYSFDEASRTKTLTVVELGEKKDGKTYTDIRTRSLLPLRDMKVLRGRFDLLTQDVYYDDLDTGNYYRIILTDEEEIEGALSELRTVYPNIMRLEYDNARTRAASISRDTGAGRSADPAEVFGALFESRNGKAADDDQSDLVRELIDKVWREK